MKWLNKTKDGFVIKIHVVPNSSKTQVIGEHGDRLKVKIKAPPVDGKANAEVIEFFSKFFGLKKNQVEIIVGETSKSKNILLRSETLDIEKLVK